MPLTNDQLKRAVADGMRMAEIDMITKLSLKTWHSVRTDSAHNARPVGDQLRYCFDRVTTMIENLSEDQSIDPDTMRVGFANAISLHEKIPREAISSILDHRE